MLCIAVKHITVGLLTLAGKVGSLLLSQNQGIPDQPGAITTRGLLAKKR